MKTEQKSFLLKCSPFFCPDLGDDQKKDLHSELARFSVQIPKRGHDSILRTIVKYLCITGTPKGRHGTMPPYLNEPLMKIHVSNIERFTYFRPLVHLSISSYIEEGFFISTLKGRAEQRVCCYVLSFTVASRITKFGNLKQ